jgi:hypothetical protein
MDLPQAGVAVPTGNSDIGWFPDRQADGAVLGQALSRACPALTVG